MSLNDHITLVVSPGAAEVVPIICIKSTGKVMRASSSGLRICVRGVRVPRGDDTDDLADLDTLYNYWCT